MEERVVHENCRMCNRSIGYKEVMVPADGGWYPAPEERNRRYGFCSDECWGMFLSGLGFCSRSGWRPEERRGWRRCHGRKFNKQGVRVLGVACTTRNRLRQNGRRQMKGYYNRR